MREYNFGIIIMALVVNAFIVTVAMLMSLINTVNLFLLMWFVPNIILTLWACILYHKSGNR